MRILPLLLLLAASPAWAACRVDRRASVPLTERGGVLVVPVTLNGTEADFILDTGAERSVVGTAAAERLHLRRDEWVSTDIQGAGGRDRQRLGRPDSLSLGGIALRRHTMAADNSLVVGPMLDALEGHPIAGLLGEDFLSPYDLDLDPASGRLDLYEVTGCAGRFLPWTEPYRAISAWRPVRNILAVKLRIGATELAAELDSGASTTVITLPGMIQLGLLPGGEARVTGFGRDSLAARTQAFPAVSAAGEPPAPASLLIAPVHTLRSIGALLGADWLRTRRVWISWATNQIFVATRED